MIEEMKELGQVAFEAYKATVGGIGYDGTTIPEWNALSATVQAGWRAAAHEAARIQLARAHNVIMGIFDKGDG